MTSENSTGQAPIQQRFQEIGGVELPIPSKISRSSIALGAERMWM
jgi:hypothetical protein